MRQFMKRTEGLPDQEATALYLQNYDLIDWGKG